ncbi:hydroxyacylglutathione hydrolase C-terminal domain-containing protein [Coxiella-like endosymbiont]|uniref:hydroxyacylglutathione hydrolase C-terminal domain-containing protein n=1 Tax=Coxiella-like endosymbiont TaxID=1592897 RepID=UPI0034E3016E
MVINILRKTSNLLNKWLIPTILDLKKRITETQQRLNQNLPALSSTLQLKLDSNPFLRCHEKACSEV